MLTHHPNSPKKVFLKIAHNCITKEERARELQQVLLKHTSPRHLIQSGSHCYTCRAGRLVPLSLCKGAICKINDSYGVT